MYFRKPRTSSWAVSSVSDYPSTPPTSQTPELVEPVYDNLGLRTTASGNSVLNLNKLIGNNGKPSTTAFVNLQNYSSMKNRPLPATPGIQQAGEVDNFNNHNISAASTLNRSHKERPKPPPKPMKKPQTNNGDLHHQNAIINSNDFEGEDGTEV